MVSDESLLTFLKDLEEYTDKVLLPHSSMTTEMAIISALTGIYFLYLFHCTFFFSISLYKTK